MENTLKNAIAKYKREWLKYGSGCYNLDMLVECARNEYLLRDDEIEVFEKAMNKFYEKKYYIIDNR